MSNIHLDWRGRAARSSVRDSCKSFWMPFQREGACERFGKGIWGKGTIVHKSVTWSAILVDQLCRVRPGVLSSTKTVDQEERRRLSVTWSTNFVESDLACCHRQRLST